MSDWQLELAEFVNQAERDGKWLRSKYQGIEFSPSELRKAHLEGRFVWGVVNWDLVDPNEILQRAEHHAATVGVQAAQHVEQLRARMQRGPSDTTEG